MADVFISYSKQEPEPTIALARDLEALGYSVWWDTSLFPDDPFFPETIKREITEARAAIVIWSDGSVRSRWVYAEAQTADEQGKLIQVRTASLDPRDVPLPFKAGQISTVDERAKIRSALQRRGVLPTPLKQSQLSDEPKPTSARPMASPGMRGDAPRPVSNPNDRGFGEPSIGWASSSKQSEWSDVPKPTSSTPEASPGMWVDAPRSASKSPNRSLEGPAYGWANAVGALLRAGLFFAIYLFLNLVLSLASHIIALMLWVDSNVVWVPLINTAFILCIAGFLLVEFFVWRAQKR